jgi:hypothetical protein
MTVLVENGRKSVPGARELNAQLKTGIVGDPTPRVVIASDPCKI